MKIDSHPLRQNSDSSLQTWRNNEVLALDLIKTAGTLRFERSVELVFFRKSIYDARPDELLDFHKGSTKFTDHPVLITVSLSIAKAIAKLENLVPSKIDLGKLGAEWKLEQANFPTMDAFVQNKLHDFIQEDKSSLAPRDVVLYGFGRIGRLAARRIIELTGGGEQLRLKAIVLRSKMSDRYEEVKKRASLLKEDTVHGTFRGSVQVNDDGSQLIINGNPVQMIFAGKPSEINYTEYGIHNALLIDNTGVWRDKASLSGHLRPGIAQVMLTAPAKDVPNIVFGVNHSELYTNKDPVYCAASCTTNAIVPILSVIENNFGIEKGHIETIHAYTSDQNLLDNFHKKPRRGRGAATNMVLTTTGAAKAVSKVLPQLAGKLTGNAIRVPTPNVSLAIMNLHLKKVTTRDELVNILKEACLGTDFFEQIHYSDSTEYVSSQAVGMTTTSVLDAPSTIVSPDGLSATIYAWYDNEFGYTCQVIRLAKHAAGVRRKNYY